MLNYGSQPDVLGPLTAAQRAIWAAQQLRPEIPYNFAGYLAIDHHVDAEKLMVACESAVARYGTACARLSLDDGGEPVFVVDRSFPQALCCVDLRAESEPVAAARNWMENDYCRPVDLRGDRLTHFALLRITDDLSYFYLRTHHVLVDGFGANNLIRHVAAVYSGSVAGTADVDFSEFALIRDADLLYRGVEVSTLAQREHRVDRLEAQAKSRGMDTTHLQHYFDFFRYGVPPHGGFGFGSERFVMKLLNLESVREAQYLFRGPNRLSP